MKRTRRITVEIIKRRQQIVLCRPEVPPAGAPFADVRCLPEVCPLCGSDWVLLHDPSPGTGSDARKAISHAFTGLDLHFGSAPDGRLWACHRSLDQLCKHWKEAQ